MMAKFTPTTDRPRENAGKAGGYHSKKKAPGAQLKNTTYITQDDSCFRPWCGCGAEKLLEALADIYGFLTNALEGYRVLP